MVFPQVNSGGLGGWAELECIFLALEQQFIRTGRNLFGQLSLEPGLLRPEKLFNQRPRVRGGEPDVTPLVETVSRMLRLRALVCQAIGTARPSWQVRSVRACQPQLTQALWHEQAVGERVEKMSINQELVLMFA